MTRLTYKDERVCGGYSAVDTDEFACVSKLGKLEDIEEEIGVDLITLFKALKDEVYGVCLFDEKNPKIYKYKVAITLPYIHGVSLDAEREHSNGWDIKDYGKTRALTKEELENE